MADRNAEIALARSAAPVAIARDAEVVILGHHGYETAIKGTNGFVCIVERSWMLPYDDPEFWDPQVRLPLCLNPPAGRSHLPLTLHQTELALSGLSKSHMFDRTKAAFDKNELPVPERGSMCYMMSKQQNFGPKYGNADPHLMFWFPQKDHVNWGAVFPGSLVDVHQYGTLRSQLQSFIFQCPSGRTEPPLIRRHHFEEASMQTLYEYAGLSEFGSPMYLKQTVIFPLIFSLAAVSNSALEKKMESVVERVAAAECSV